MSFYNILYGTSVTATFVLQMLEISSEVIPRFRDAWIEWKNKDNKIPQICIYTRTGGGNRTIYDIQKGADQKLLTPNNDDLRKLPGYIIDIDDDYDNTYAKFYYKVPDLYKQLCVDYLDHIEEPLSLKDKMEKFLESL